MALGRKNCNPSGAHSTPPGKPVKRAPADNLPPLKAWDGWFPKAPQFRKALFDLFDVWRVDERKRGPVQWVSFDVPQMVHDTVSFLRETKDRGERIPGLKPSLYCILTYGLALIWNHPAFQSLRDSRAFFRSLGQDGTPEEEAISNVLKTPIRMAFAKSGVRAKVPVWPCFNDDFHALAEDIPCGNSELAAICCYAYLEHIDTTPHNYRERMKGGMQTFFFLVEMKAAQVEAMATKKAETAIRRDRHPLLDVDFHQPLLDATEEEGRPLGDTWREDVPQQDKQR